MALFTTGDVMRLVKGLGLELSEKTFSTWCRDGTVASIAGGGGTGNHRVFALMQLVGIGVAVGVRNTKQGCHTRYVKMVVSAFSEMSENKLAKMLEGEAIYFLTTGGKSVILDDNRTGDRVNVKRIYKAVMKLK